MLSTDRDRTAMREVVAGALDLLAGAPMRALVADVVTGDTARPGESLRDAPDEVLDAWVATSGPYLHAAGSCPLGTVLDEWGRVPGVSGLRVVDASALPVLPAVAPNATVTVLAAHIAANW
jgi:choline dehydrogenase-like flavoprotein